MPLPNVISLPVERAADLTGRSRYTLYRAIKNGHLKAFKPSTNSRDVATGKMLVMVDDLQAWLRANPVVPSDIVDAVPGDVR